MFSFTIILFKVYRTVVRFIMYLKVISSIIFYIFGTLIYTGCNASPPEKIYKFIYYELAFEKKTIELQATSMATKISENRVNITDAGRKQGINGRNRIGYLIDQNGKRYDCFLVNGAVIIVICRGDIVYRYCLDNISTRKVIEAEQ